jgi:HSP20 family molecular chaperone IbpA
MNASIKKFIHHKATFAALGFVLGLGADWGVHAIKPAPTDPSAEFFQPVDPLREFTKMQEHLFAEAPVFETVSAPATLKVEEDEGHVFYVFSIPDLNAKDVQVRVENGAVVLQGASEKTQEESNQHSFITSSFHQSYPWPSGVQSDTKKVKIKYEKDRIRVEFPKEDNANGYT